MSSRDDQEVQGFLQDAVETGRAIPLEQASGITTSQSLRTTVWPGAVAGFQNGHVEPFGPVNPNENVITAPGLVGVTLPEKATIEENGKKVTISWPGTAEEVDRFSRQVRKSSGTIKASSEDPAVIKQVEAAKDRAAKDKATNSHGGYKVWTDASGNLSGCTSITKV